MKAAACTKYGPPEVVELVDLPEPEPGKGEVRIRVRATTLHVGDSRMRAFRVPTAMWLPARLALGVLRPRKPVLGMELAGTIDAVGAGVDGFAVGDDVFAMTGMRFGGHAEAVCLGTEGHRHKNGLVAPLPDGVGFEEAAPLPAGGLTAWLVLRTADIQAGQRVLVYGASGSVGTYAVQLVRNLLGGEVTGVCSEANLELVQSLGAERVIDYAADEFAALDERYDVVFDAVGKLPRARARQLLADGGTHLNVLSSSDDLTMTRDDLVALGELATAGKIRAVIDRTYTLEEIVEAHRYVDQGHKRGNVLVVV